MSRSKKSIEQLNRLGGTMTAAEVRRLLAERDAVKANSDREAKARVVLDFTPVVLDPALEGARRLELDLPKMGIETLSDLIELAALRNRPIPEHRLRDYRWIHSHVCEYIKQFHPSENQILLEQAQTAS